MGFGKGKGPKDKALNIFAPGGGLFMSENVRLTHFPRPPAQAPPRGYLGPFIFPFNPQPQRPSQEPLSPP